MSGSEKPDNGIARLVDAIGEVGGENYSKLARMVGMPEETVRYKVNRQFPKQRIAIHLGINYDKISLSRKIISVTFPSQYIAKAARALEEVSEELYVTYYAKTIGSKVITLMLVVPNNGWTEYKDFLVYLKENGILESYQAEDLVWYKHFPLMTDLYDFQKGEWNFRWEDLEKLKISPVEIPATNVSITLEEPDKMDLQILTELQSNANVSVSKMAESLKVSEDIAYYHFTEHVKKRNMIGQHIVGWVGTGGSYDKNSVSKVIFSFENVKQDGLNKVREVFYRFPFSWMELYTTNSNYYVFANIPSTQLNAPMHFIDQHGSGLGKLDIRICDSYDSAGFPLPTGMFDEKKGWQLNKARMIKDFQGYFK